MTNITLVTRWSKNHGTFGKLDEFQQDQETWSVYVEHFELFAATNSVKEAKRVPMFLIMIGGKMYALLHNLFSLENRKDKSYAEIVAKLKEHFEPEPMIIAQRFHFHRKNQGPNKSIADYIVELRRYLHAANLVPTLIGWYAVCEAMQF